MKNSATSSESHAAQSGVSVVVAGGVHDGAHAFLAKGTHLLGGAAHCDFVLREIGVAPELLLVHVSDADAFVRALADGLMQDGQPVAGNVNLGLMTPRVLSFGSIRLGFCLGDVSAQQFAWPSRDDAQAQSLTTDRVPQVALETPERLPLESAAFYRRPAMAVLAVALGVGSVGWALSVSDRHAFA